MMGGGSAALAPHYRISPLDALRARVGGAATVVYERGGTIDRTAPPIAPPRVTTPDGTPGLLLERFVGTDLTGEPVERRTTADGRVMVLGDLAAPPDAAPTSLRVSATYTPDETGLHTFTFVQAGGSARVWLDDGLVFDGIDDPPPPGTEMFGMGSEEVAVEVALTAGSPVALTAEFTSPPGPGFLYGLKLGCRLPEPPDLLDRAAAAAAAADVAVVVVGTNDDGESEGHDRESMDLPGTQDELVRQVVAANPRTVVVLNTGSPVTMDWADDAPAILQAWFGGQEMANALADVLTGAAEPAGRLPTTLPLRLEHNPAFGNFPGENSEVRYGEGLLVGYRWYDTRHLPVRFPFGHGLSYSSFTIGPPLAPARFTPGEPLVIDVPVENTGTRRGSEVVQCYVEPCAPRLTRPRRELRAFAKVVLDAGARTTVRLELDDRAFACWDPADPWWATTAAQRAAGPVAAGTEVLHREEPGWYVDPGEYRIHIGRSVADLPHTVTVTVTD
jgi:beta-glucosidase